MTKLKTALAVLLLLPACGGVQGNIEQNIDPVVHNASERDGKADHVTLPFRVVDGVQLPRGFDSETRLIFTSENSYRRFFGTASTIDFSREWAVVYAAGLRATGGYAASVLEVSTTAGGAVLDVVTKLESPGRNCLVTEALTRPFVLVAFAKPRPRPYWLRWYHADTTRDCTVLTCASMLCAPGYFCSEHTGEAQCVSYLTCENAEMACAPGFHCEDTPIVCITAPCAPTAPTCVEDTNRCSVEPHRAESLNATFENLEKDTEGGIYPRTYAFDGRGGVKIQDAIAPCPTGSQCVWSGYQVVNATYRLESDKVFITYETDTTNGFSLSYFKELSVRKDCWGALQVVEVRNDGTAMERVFTLPPQPE